MLATFVYLEWFTKNKGILEYTPRSHNNMLWYTLTLHFNGCFPGGPGQASTRMSWFWILLKPRMMEVVVTTGAIRCTKLQSDHDHQQTNTQSFFTGRMPFLSPTNSVKALNGNALLYYCYFHFCFIGSLPGHFRSSRFSQKSSSRNSREFLVVPSCLVTVNALRCILCVM